MNETPDIKDATIAELTRQVGVMNTQLIQARLEKQSLLRQLGEAQAKRPQEDTTDGAETSAEGLALGGVTGAIVDDGSARVEGAVQEAQ